MAKKKPRHGEIDIDSQRVMDLLAQKHGDDVFVPECKDGPSQCTTHFRLDAWVMKKSWSNPLTIGYEVKVNRQDFLRDDKWQAYLVYCNEFYFVCPQGVISETELPPEAGLYCVSATGARLFLKKKCVRRNVEIPENLWRYVLMCRAKISRNQYDDTTKDNVACWRKWLAEKKANRELGYNVSRAIQETLRTRVEEAKQQVRDAERRMNDYDEIRRFLKRELGTDEVSHWCFRRDFKKLRAAVPDDLYESISRTLNGCERLKNELDGIRKSVGETDSEISIGAFDA